MQKSKREHILEIAFDYFVEKGYENTNMRQICKAVNVEPPTVYYYFDSKRGLFFEIAKKLNDKYKCLLNGQKILEKEITAAEKLFELFKFNVSYAKDHPRDIKFHLRYDLFPPEEIAEELADFQHSVIEEKNEIEHIIFSECVRQGFIDQEHKDSVKKAYIMLVSKYRYFSALFGYCPSSEEIVKSWKSFSEDHLKPS